MNQSKPTIAEFEALEARVFSLEKLVKRLVSQKRKPRKQRVYTEEEKKTIRARLLEG